jgi:hypothetical protein
LGKKRREGKTKGTETRWEKGGPRDRGDRKDN